MVDDDLTVIYLTINNLPQRWVDFHSKHLLHAVEDRPMVVVSAKPMDFGRPNTEYLIQEPPFGHWRVYSSLLRGASLATTKYVAVAEDDTLYTRKHFSDFRPPDDAVAYDMSRWSVFSWKGEEAFFSAIRRHGNFMMIGPRQLVIGAIEEREDKYPNGNDYAGEIGRPDVERTMGATRHKLVEWYSVDASVNLCHTLGLSPTYVNTKGRERKTGELKAFDVPGWGRASEIAKIYNDGVAEEKSGRTL